MPRDQKLCRLFIEAIPFVLARRKESGGYGATPRLPATIQDTYYALNILSLHQQYDSIDQNAASLLHERSLQTYLTRCQKLIPSTGIATTFQLLKSCRTAGVQFDLSHVGKEVISRMQDGAALEEWYFCTRILRELLEWDPLKIVAQHVVAPVLLRPWRCVDELWRRMYLAQAFSMPLSLPAPQLVNWLRACQNGDGGFGFFPGTTSFVENCHAALRALALLKQCPQDPVRAALFLAGSQTASGGFSRNGRAAPFLDATWHALAALLLVSLSTADGHGLFSTNFQETSLS
jgi:hypothetical protein